MTTQIKRTRTVSLANSKIDTEARTVEVAFSSNAEVDRGGFIEILSHERGAMDTHRLEDGAAVLVDHDWTDQVGVVESIEIDHAGGVGRAVLRFGRSTRAEEIFLDVQDGIRKHISFGYIVTEERKLDGRRGVEVTKYEPYEISFVSVPADVTVGVGRSAEEPEEPQPDPEETPEPTEPEQPEENTESNTEDQAMTDTVNAVKAERERIAKIRKLGQKFGFVEQAERAIEDGTSVQDFAYLMGEQSPNVGATESTQPTGSQAEAAGITERDLSQYSIARAVKAAASNDWSKAGLEREVSLAIGEARGREACERGFIVPHEALIGSVRAGNDTGNSSEITPVDYRPDRFIDLLRDQTMVGRLGAQMLTGLKGMSKLDIPAQLSDATTSWVTEGHTNDISSGLTFGTVSIVPKILAGAVPLTRQVRQQSNPLIDTLVRRSLMYSMARALDTATFKGTGVNDPLGILDADRVKDKASQTKNTALGKVGTVAATIGDAGDMIPGWKDIVAMETALDEMNFSGGSIHYCMPKATRGALKTTMKSTDAGNNFGWIMPTGNELNGYPAVANNLFKTDEDFIFGDFSAVLWAFWSSVDLRVDTATNAQNDGIVIRTFQDCGMELERNSAFVKLTAKTA